METFKKATVAGAAVAILAAGAYTGLQGLSSILSDRFTDFLVKREAAVQQAEAVAK